MLLSGAGLLAFALVDLWGAVRDADEVARREARAGAERVADSLTALLADERVLAAMPPLGEFELREGAVVVPPEVGWLRVPPAPYAERDLPLRAGVLLQRARRAEVVEEDRAKAQRLLDQARAAQGLSPRDRVHLLIESGWQATRFDQRERGLRHWDELVASAGLDMRAAASALLLAEALRVGEARSAVLGRLRRIAAALPREAGVEIPGAASAQRRRQLLAAVAALENPKHGQFLPAVPGLQPGAGPPGPAGWTLLLYGDAAHQRGALVWNPGLRGWLSGRSALPNAGTSLPLDPFTGFQALPDSARWRHAWGKQISVLPANWSDDAVVFNSGLAIEPRVVPAPFWANPVLLIVLLAVLTICFGGGLFFSFRSILRESAAMRSRADFLTSVTHELKTPLSSIRLLSEMLEEGRVKGDAKCSEYYRLLAGESARLTVLIENVLDLGRMERGERAYDLRPNPVDEVVAEASRVFEPVANRDGMQLELDLAAGDRVADVDRGALVQALLNVMDNARKYAGDGGKLDVRSRGQDGSYYLSVRDHGPGIPAADRTTIFDRFRRGDAQRHGAISGVGLGLYLAKTILEAHGGSLAYLDPEGGGAEFVFSLPLHNDS